MPYNIPSGNQQFSSGGSQARSQNWSFFPSQVEALSSLHVLQAQPPAVNVTVGIRDILSSSYASTHSAFKLVVTVIQDGQAPDLFSVTSSSHDISQEINLDASTNLSLLLEVAFIDPTILLEGNYVGYIDFKINATNIVTGLSEIIDTAGYQMTLERAGESTNVVTPRTINLAYVQGSSSPTINFDIIPANIILNDLRWGLSYENDLNISIPGIPSSNPPYTVLDGDGTQTGQLSLNTSVWDSKSLGIHDTLFNVLFKSINALYGVDVNVAVLDQNGAIVQPNNLSFTTTAPNNPQSQYIDIFSTQGFLISAPAWIEISNNSGSGSARIEVKPIDISNFSRGVYDDIITITASGNTYNVQVRYQVNDDLKTDISNSAYNFTKDGKFFKVDGFDENHFLQIDSKIKTYDINDNEYTLRDRVKIPYFNATASYSVGALIHQATKWISSPEDVSLGLLIPNFSVNRESYCKRALVDFNIKVIDRRDNTVRLDRNLADTKWCPGKYPRYADPGMAYLNYNLNVQRITEEGFAVINAFSVSPTTLRLFKNGTLTGNYVLNSGEYPAERILIDGSQFEKGDVIKAELSYLNEGILIKQDKYILIYPTEEYSNHLAYLTSYNTIELIQCTGVLTGASNYNRRTNTLIKNEVDTNIDVLITRDDQLVLNTGYIPEDQRYMIDELMKSKAVWIVASKYKESIPVKMKSSELSHTDSERFLHNYTLELTVNRTIDEEIYLF